MSSEESEVESEVKSADSISQVVRYRSFVLSTKKRLTKGKLRVRLDMEH